LHFTRRDWLKTAALASAGSLSSRVSLAQAGDTVPHAVGAVRTLPRYADALSVPVAIRPRQSVIEVATQEFLHKVHRDLPPTRMWGYGGTWPGPTFEVHRGQSLTVRWLNKLPAKHFLPIDHSIHGADESLPEVRTVVHVHGLKVLPEHDGYPEA
jgi:spore coat protein A